MQQVRWFVTTGGAPIGPVSEQQVIEMLRSGMRVTGVCRDGEQWWDWRAYPPFAAATFAPQKKKPAWPLVIGLGGAGFMLLVVVVSVLSPSTGQKTHEAPAPTEVVMTTIPLEAGEGDARGQSIHLHSDHGMLILLSGDRIERLQDRADQRARIGPPSDTARVRVTSGGLKGEVGYLRLIYVQAAR